ncbi:recombinase family protein [Mesorhizobium sp. VK24D]|uniref:Recombinase family protein n=1 Tax=Mesorhizobium album TaxID=3072314 RepID=A0ABU4Y6J5_9HYPH|nr:recombinase family protein [Mesorhizobium sp. VK24D]MDX8482567.1 recombinase family protein [Mesorhizobium sp. VK24D]
MIVPEEADVIRRIFREFASGKSPRAIAVDLNKDGIPGPLGRAWGDTSIQTAMKFAQAHHSRRKDKQIQPFAEAMA